MNPGQVSWLTDVISSAKAADHIFPEMAACEAALESGFGSSALARQDNNLFGMKQHEHPIYGTVILPTKEFLNGMWKEVDAAWIKYDTMAECFEDRMETLERLKDKYPHYAAALAASDPLTYITEVSKTWSTDPERAYKVLSIFKQYKSAVTPQTTSDLSTGDL